MNRVLILAAHPDDEVLGCGGLISKYHKVGVVFKVIFVGEGSSCRFQDYQGEAAKSEIAKRNLCAQIAMRFLGVDDVEFNNLPCGRLDQVPIIEINKIIEKGISDFQPDTIFTHSEFDANNDHRIVNRATIMATRPCATKPIHRVYSFEVLSSTEWQYSSVFKPTVFFQLDIEEVMAKWRALESYDTEVREFPFPRSKEGLFTQARYRGMQAGFEYAEAFSLIREYVS